ncbi:MAG TPA: triose-phosphate isomerase [Bacteroidia bacterium]|nr:triose-phosphate isomerase [Bacteroidia bacterium]
MRQKIVAGNWKMNCTHQEAVTLTTEITELLKNENTGDVKIIIAPPFVHLGIARYLTQDEKRISIAAQNCSSFASGAYTGEVSAAMIESVAATYVIIGHSERRNYFNETNAALAEKTKLALQNNLTPVFCCGETLDERKANNHFEVIAQQLNESVFLLDEKDFRKIIIAYEPVWAIGTGVTASPAQAQEIHAFIRNLIAKKYSYQAAESASILYGGSCNEQNAKELFSQKDIDGGLIGGASLKAQSFVKIIKSF